MFRMNADADKVDLWIDAGFNGLFGKEIFRGKFLHANLAVADEKLYDYYFDYLAAAFLKVAAKGKDKLAISSALGKSYLEYTCGNYDKASRRLRAVLEKPSESDLTVTAVGHSHLDLAWLWPMRETERKAARTVSNAIRNTERYSEYVYGASQPQEFVWLKEQYPALYERVKKAFEKAISNRKAECGWNATPIYRVAKRSSDSLFTVWISGKGVRRVRQQLLVA